MNGFWLLLPFLFIRFVQLFAGRNEPRRICGLSNRAEIVNPDKDDVEKALYILRKYRNINQ